MNPNNKNKQGGKGEKPSPDPSQNFTPAERLILWVAFAMRNLFRPVDKTIDKLIKKYIDWQAPQWIKFSFILLIEIIILVAALVTYYCIYTSRVETESAVKSSSTGDIFSVLVGFVILACIVYSWWKEEKTKQNEEEEQYIVASGKAVGDFLFGIIRKCAPRIPIYPPNDISELDAELKKIGNKYVVACTISKKDPSLLADDETIKLIYLILRSMANKYQKYIGVHSPYDPNGRLLEVGILDIKDNGIDFSIYATWRIAPIQSQNIVIDIKSAPVDKDF